MASGPADVLLVRLFVCSSTSAAVNVHPSLSSVASSSASWSGVLSRPEAGAELEPASEPEAWLDVWLGAARGGGTLLLVKARLRLSSDCSWLAGMLPALSLMPVSGEKGDLM